MADWETRRLGDVAQLKMGQSPPGSRVTDLDGGLPFLQGNAEFGSRCPTATLQCDEAARRSAPGDSLISVRAPVGAINRADRGYGIGRGLAAVAFDVIDPDFGHHALIERSRDLQRVSQGTTFSAIGRMELAALRLPVPPLEEQRGIAEILDTIDETIHATERVFTKLVCVRRGQVDDLLGPLPLNSSLGAGLERIDAGWSPACVDRPPMEQEWGVLKVSSITTEEFDPSESKTMPTTLRYRPQLVVKVGDVLTARANGVADLVARTAIVDHVDHKNLMISDKTLRLVTRPALSARYLTYCMQHEMVRCQVRGFVSGSTGQGNISQQELRSLRLAIPDLRQQMHVEQAITAIDARIAAEKNRNKKLRQLRSGLAADLLSGRVRTVAA